MTGGYFHVGTKNRYTRRFSIMEPKIVHYDAIENKHGLRHDPFKALVVPRPIGWISSVSADGVYNLAPYSFLTP